MDNILVAGGAGYIGSYMCKYLAQNGYNPIALDNRNRMELAQKKPKRILRWSI